MVRGKSHQRLGAGTGRKDAAGDGSGLFPHLRLVLLRRDVPQIHGGQVKDCDEAGDWRFGLGLDEKSSSKTIARLRFSH